MGLPRLPSEGVSSPVAEDPAVDLQLAKKRYTLYVSGQSSPAPLLCHPLEIPQSGKWVHISAY